VIAFDVRHYDSIGSTNDEAMRLGHAGAPHGTVVCAREQKAGRGRQARRWHSPPGNLYASVLLRIAAPPSRAAELSFVAALAVAETLDRFLGDDLRAELKWPNDVLVRGAKIAGILLEQAHAMVVVGIGINVQRAPLDAHYPVTHLAAGVAAAPKPGAVLHVLLQSLAHRLADWRDNGFVQTRSDWLARAHPLGTPIRISIGDRWITGQFAGLAHDGGLIVQTADGPVRIVAGDVVISAISGVVVPSNHAGLC
jgi:BirA family transcriptional regulator, biotin operon repressor / biotin---[acetyl-CoA-carboxylase] ligase